MENDRPRGVFGGELAVSGILFTTAIALLAASALIDSSAGLWPYFLELALWNGVLSRFLLFGGPRWHVVTLVTVVLYAAFCLRIIATSGPGAGSIYGVLFFGGAAIYLLFTVSRKRRIYGL